MNTPIAELGLVLAHLQRTIELAQTFQWDEEEVEALKLHKQALIARRQLHFETREKPHARAKEQLLRVVQG